MGRMRENLRMENQLIVDLIYTLFIKVSQRISEAAPKPDKDMGDTGPLCAHCLE